MRLQVKIQPAASETYFRGAQEPNKNVAMVCYDTRLQYAMIHAYSML